MRTSFLTALAAVLAIAQPASAQVLWSNGTNPTSGGMVNQDYLGTGSWRARSYDNFQLSGSSLITGFFGTFNPGNGAAVDWTNATWEVRTGMAPGNFGTLIASGAGPVSRTPVSNGYYTELTGLNLSLSAGTYWLFFGPQTRTDFYAVFSNLVQAPTDAVNALQDQYVLWEFGSGLTVAPAGFDLQLGALGQSSVVPEPASLVLLASGLGVLGLAARRRRSKA